MVISWGIDSGDNWRDFVTHYEFVSDKDLDDIGKLMREHGVKRWVSNPESVTEKTWKEGDGSLIEYRNLTVRPIKVVESWGYSRDTIND